MSSQQPDPTVSSRTVALAEIISVVLSCLIAEWVFLSFLSQYRWLVIVPLLLAVTFMLVSHRAYLESARDIGFRFDNILPAFRLLVWPTLIAVVAILVIGWYLTGPPSFPRLLRPRLLLVPAWALFQQYALQGFMNRRAQLAFGKGLKSVILVAAIFGVLHLPNPVLAILTVLGGLIWAAVYQREANLFALAASHTVASVTLAMALPLNVINGLRVGFKYFG
ncbi:MAG TPA: CPBP family glutamic-type intramembrane protease [Pyrinomonadaceae bacterium]